VRRLSENEQVGLAVRYFKSPKAELRSIRRALGRVHGTVRRSEEVAAALNHVSVSAAATTSTYRASWSPLASWLGLTSVSTTATTLG
jgi:hypothetical protein